MTLEHPYPAHRIFDYAAQLRRVIKDLRHNGISPFAINSLQEIAYGMCACANIWDAMYGPDKLPVAVPPAVPRLKKGGMKITAAQEPPRVVQFWRIYEVLSAEIGGDILEPLNHSSNPGQIAINFKYTYSRWYDSDLPVMDMKLLQTGFKRSFHLPLIEKNRLMRSRLTGKSLRCWVFEKP